MTKVNIYTTSIDEKAMPSAPELEEAVLGAILLEHECLAKVASRLKPDVFYRPAHQMIYAAIQELHNSKAPVDFLSVVQKLKEHGNLETVGGAYFVTQLTNRVASSANVEYHSTILIQQHLRREMIRIGASIANESYEDTTDPLDAIESLKKNIIELEDLTGLNVRLVDTQKKLDEVFLSIGQDSPQTMREKTFTWGLIDLDLKCPLMRGLTYVEAGRPGMGKTALVKKVILANAIEKDEIVIMFSQEMPIEQLTEDLVSMMTGINSEKIRRRDLSTHERMLIGETRSKLRKNLIIDDRGGITYQDVISRVTKEKKEHGDVGIVIIDYLQLMTVERHEAKGKNRDQELSIICNGLSNFAKNENFALIEVSQLSREVEKRNPPRPIIPDLRDSGAIEQNAVAILFLFRPEYYGIFEDANGTDLRGLCEINVAKFRLGNIGPVQVRFIKENTLFVDYVRI